MTETPSFILERRFNAAPELVWKVWTDEKHQSRWYGPGVETVVHKNEMKPGGRWLIEMKSGTWTGYQRADYVEVDAPERLVFLQSMTDADWSVTTPPEMPDWPRVMRTEVSFRPTSDGKTDFRLVWTPHEASEAEVVFFTGVLDAMGQGWSAGMAILDDILSELQE